MTTLFQNIDLLSVGLAIAAIGVLGFVVFFNNVHSATNRLFLYFALITICWSAVNYLNYQSIDPVYGLLLIRLTVFLGLFHALTFYEFFTFFPASEITLSKRHVYLLLPAAFSVALLTLTPLIFTRATETIGGRVTGVQNGPLLPLYGVFVIALVAGGMFKLVRKMRHAEGKLKARYLTILYGAGATFALLLTFNFVLPAFFENTTFIPYGAVFLLPFIAATGYAILKQRLFRVKVASTAVLVFGLAFGLFAEIVYTTSTPLILFRSGIFVLVLIIGINLIRSVMREVEQREHIGTLAEKLQAANEGQANLIHVINHQIKGYLSKGRNIFSEYLTNPNFEQTISGNARVFAQQGFDILTEGSQFVQGVLSASSIENGTMVYSFEPIDLSVLIRDAVEKQRALAEKKGLSYTLSLAPGDYRMEGDAIQLKEAFRNLLDNSIRYTPTGEVAASLVREADMIRFTVRDSGVGITSEDKTRLFTNGGRGKDSQKVNVDSTGYGLSFVKGVITAHHGSVTATSEGKGKGSTFTVVFPL